MKTGKIIKALEWADNLGFPEIKDISMRREMEYIVLARILIYQRNSEKAGILLDYLMQDAKKGNRRLRIVELQILRSINYYLQDEIEKSLDELYTALKFSEPNGLFRIFVYEGDPLAELIEVMLKEKIEHKKDPYPKASRKYLEDILRAIREDRSSHSDSGLDEPLSEREHEVLENIADGLTNKQIADKLYVSLNTIRTHTKKIFSKLGVHSRTQAIAKAKELGLIE
jgi:LuxR family maltose regulon positive regulatory protein